MDKDICPVCKRESLIEKKWSAMKTALGGSYPSGSKYYVCTHCREEFGYPLKDSFVDEKKSNLMW